jgi:tRNA-specific adenosine deaminase 2
MSALYNLNVKDIVYGCKNDRFGGETVLNVAELIKNDTKVQGGLFDADAMSLLKQFYSTQNESAPVGTKSGVRKNKDKNKKI